MHNHKKIKAHAHIRTETKSTAKITIVFKKFRIFVQYLQVNIIPARGVLNTEYSQPINPQITLTNQERNNIMLEEDRIIKINIENEMKSAYIDYSMSVIVSRALPDVRDGLKPVHRRVLYGMNEMGNTSDKPTRKSAKAVGEVMGKYHPHGDGSIYGTIVRMAQPWAMRECLVEGQGNFGSIDGDGPAAMRYTEIRLQKIGEEMLRDIDSDSVDFQPNYDNSDKEPTVLPTRIPNLLVNGASGIAVGMATNMPTHNLAESIIA